MRGTSVSGAGRRVPARVGRREEAAADRFRWEGSQEASSPAAVGRRAGLLTAGGAAGALLAACAAPQSAQAPGGANQPPVSLQFSYYADPEQVKLFEDVAALLPAAEPRITVEAQNEIAKLRCARRRGARHRSADGAAAGAGMLRRRTSAAERAT